VVKLSPTGAVSGTPYQHTEVTASSDGTAKTEVPMSDSGMRKIAGTQPTVKNGVGDFSFSQNGTSTQNVRSDFAGQVPLTVKPTYELDGKSVSASDLAPTTHGPKKDYKSGTLKVTYDISNISKEKTTVSFVGFNGAHITQTITDPIPIVAELKITFPKDATDINASGANLASGKEGVKATWDMLLAAPLSSSASHTISYSVHLSKVKTPEATLEADALVPPALPSDKIPEKVASALGRVEGQPEGGLGGSPLSLGQTKSDTSHAQRSGNSKLQAQKDGLTRANKSKSNSAIGNIQPGLDVLANTQNENVQNGVAQGDSRLDALNSSGSAQLNQVGSTTSDRLSNLGNSGDGQLNGLRDTTNRAVVRLASEVASGSAQADAGIGVFLSQLMNNLAAKIDDLGTPVSAHLAELSKAQTAADSLAMSATVLNSATNDLLTVVTGHVADATALDQMIAGLIVDANALPAAVHTTPEWLQLDKDLTAAKLKADLVSQVAATIAQRASAISTTVQGLEAQAVQLTTDVHNLSAEAGAIHLQLVSNVASAKQNLQSTITHVAGSFKDFQAQIAEAESAINQKIDSTRAGFAQQISGVRDGIAQTVSDAQAKLDQVTSKAKDSLSAAGSKAKGDIAAAKAKAQAAVQQAMGSVESALDKANSDYAQLLALSQIAEAHQLPSGDATGANVQNGAYVLRITSTG
jgi:hypothetical protein